MLEVIALVKFAFFLQNVPTGEWKDHSMFTLSGLPAAFQARELTAADTKENSNHLHCVKKKKGFQAALITFKV